MASITNNTQKLNQIFKEVAELVVADRNLLIRHAIKNGKYTSKELENIFGWTKQNVSKIMKAEKGVTKK